MPNPVTGMNEHMAMIVLKARERRGNVPYGRYLSCCSLLLGNSPRA